MAFGTSGPREAGGPKRRAPFGRLEAREWESRSAAALSIKLMRDPLIVEDAYSMAKIALAIQLKAPGKTPSIYMPEGKTIPPLFQRFIAENGLCVVSSVDIRKHGGIILLNIHREDIDPALARTARTVLDREGRAERGEFNYEQVMGIYGKYREGIYSPLPRSNTYMGESLITHEQVYNFIKENFGRIKRSAAESLLLDIVRIFGKRGLQSTGYVKELEDAAGTTIDELRKHLFAEEKTEDQKIIGGGVIGFSHVDTITEKEGSVRYDFFRADTHINDISSADNYINGLTIDPKKGGAVFLITFFDASKSAYRCKLMLRDNRAGNADAITLDAVAKEFNGNVEGDSAMFDFPAFEGALSNGVVKILDRLKGLSEKALLESRREIEEDLARSRRAAEAKLQAVKGLDSLFGKPHRTSEDRVDITPEEEKPIEKPRYLYTISDVDAEISDYEGKRPIDSDSRSLKERIEKLGFNCFYGYGSRGGLFIYRQLIEWSKWTDIIRACSFESMPYWNAVKFGPRDVHIIFLAHMDPSTKKIELLLMPLNDDTEHSHVKRLRKAARYLGMEPKMWEHNAYVELQGKAYGSSLGEVTNSIQGDIFREYLLM